MGERLAGKVALVTGGTSGIGAATVELFVAEGAWVLFTGRNAQAGAELANRVGDAARFVAGDVRVEDDIQRVVGEATAAFGHLDIMFSNAGAGTAGTLETVTPEQFREAMDLLVGSAVFGIKHAAAVMKAQGSGVIINNSSIAALRQGYGDYLYSAAKAAVTQLTRVAALELAPYGIRVNSISPGGIATPIFFGGSARASTMGASHVSASMAKLERSLADATPLRRSGAARDIAEAALYLASDAGGFVNGHDLVVDAGMSVAGRTHFASD